VASNEVVEYATVSGPTAAVSCPTNYVAIGGGEAGSIGVLGGQVLSGPINSANPVPPTSGSSSYASGATGWYVQAPAGPVTVYAICTQ
jgi:hypothetical protein